MSEADAQHLERTTPASRAAAAAQEASARSLATRPVIFLDIDGVLNRRVGEGDHTVDRDLLARFERLVRATDARVVLASTWRHDPTALADARRLHIPFDDVLPDLRPRSRAAEVQAWLAAHPDAGRFAVLDDEDDGYSKCPLFQPSPRKGLTSKLAQKVEAYLRGERTRDARRSVLVRMCEAVWYTIAGHKG
jgi:hypothetical protein